MGAVNIGVAAHITAASPNGPRYDPDLSPTERRAAANGIWLCQNCAKLVDSDVVRFTPKRLRAWKDEAEEVARIELETSAAVASRTPSENTPSEWWERPGAPVFRLNLGSRRGEQEWVFQVEPEQIAGGDIGLLRYSYTIAGTMAGYQLAKLLRDRKWRLDEAVFTPAAQPFEVSLRFWWNGDERTLTWHWEREDHFQSALETLIYDSPTGTVSSQSSS